MIKEIFIHSFTPVLPENHLPQSKIIEWTLDSHFEAEVLRGREVHRHEFIESLRKYCLSEKFITQRYFDCDEVDGDWGSHEIYCLTAENPNGASMEVRNKYFGRKVARVFAELYRDRIPSHLIHVTCTGYLSPSPAQVFFSKQKSSPDISHAYHMGCYASLPSIRMACGLSLQGNADVDVVHTEMCSLHLNPSLHTPEQMVVQTLFADGYMKYTVGKEPKGFRICHIKEKLIPDSTDDMTWVPGKAGMMMTLSREVPIKIRDGLPAFMEELCVQAGVDKKELLSDGIFAIHPGGPKIIEAVQKKLELKDDQVAHSKKVLLERGNMSSATLPHVWKEILDQKPKPGKKVVSLAFGPGLTIFGSIFEVIN